MKLYTEEQLREAYNRGRTDWINEIEDYYIFSELTPIELPSDEEIKENSPFNEQSYGAENCAFIEGAEWMKEQILNK